MSDKENGSRLPVPFDKESILTSLLPLQRRLYDLVSGPRALSPMELIRELWDEEEYAILKDPLDSLSNLLSATRSKIGKIGEAIINANVGRKGARYWKCEIGKENETIERHRQMMLDAENEGKPKIVEEPTPKTHEISLQSISRVAIKAWDTRLPRFTRELKTEKPKRQPKNDEKPEGATHPRTKTGPI